MGHKYSIPTSRCQKCHELNLYVVDVSQSRPFHHLGTFKELEISAGRGCDLCRYLRMVLIMCCSTFANLESSNSPIIVQKETQLGKERYGWWYRINCGLVDGDFQGPAHVRINHLLRPKDSPTSYSSVSLEDDIEKEMSTAASWLATCLATHVHTSRFEIKSAPRRLIDVGVAGGAVEPKLIILPPQSATDWIHNERKFPSRMHTTSYFTLSYCWGPNKHVAMLKKENISQFMEGIPWEKLPRTIKHAIIITRNLGVRYLWVDALCIIQPTDEDKSDWEEESARMSDIYLNSLCTIAATGATRSEEGCFIKRPWKSYPVGDCRLSLPRSGRHNLLTPLILKSAQPTYYSVSRSPLNRRGWVLQEQALSTRILHWTKEGLFWECEVSCFSGCSLREPERKVLHPPVKPCSLISDVMFDALSPEQVLMSWFEMVEEYSTRGLSNVTDKLVAFSGIAKEYQRRTQDRYMAGLWRSSLLKCLMWNRYNWDPSLAKKGTEAWKDFSQYDREPHDYLAPSWSWASKGFAHIQYTLIPDPVEWYATVIDEQSFVLLATSDATGAVSGGQLCINASLKTITVDQQSSDITNYSISARKGLELWKTSSPPGASVYLRFDDPEATIDDPPLCMYLYSPHKWRHEGLIIRAVDISETAYHRLGTFELLGPSRKDNYFNDERKNIILI